MGKMMFLKMLAVGVLTGVMLVALAAVYGVLSSRQSYREEAIASIAQSYAGQQRIVGPVVVVPYTRITKEITIGTKGEQIASLKESTGRLLAFPQTLTCTVRLRPSERRHGLYKVTVYESDDRVEAVLDMPEAEKTMDKIVYGVPMVVLGVSDVRGIVGVPSLTVNGSQAVVQGLSEMVADNWKPNLKAMAPGLVLGSKGVRLELAMTLAGTEKLAVAPVAAMNRIAMESTWASPLFAGEFLPRTREVSQKGFHAEWEVSSLASATQTQINGAQDGKIDAIDVSLLHPIDPYKLSDRAVKYGVLFILLTFGGFFLFELVKQLPIHPIQYLLVGFALTLFFLLLISLSEHIAFAAAYSIACVACIGLVTYYLCSVLRNVRYGIWFGVLLSLFYAAIYGLLISEDNALMLGSILLFVLLAAIMIATRGVDWRRDGMAPPVQKQ